MKIKLFDVRLAFPVLHEAKAVNGEGEPRFSATFLLPPDHKDAAILKAAIIEIATDKWNEKAGEILKQLQAKDRLCLHKGESKPEYDGFAGMLYVQSSSKNRPMVMDRDKTPLVQADGRPYAGCYVNAVLELWAQDNNYGKRINAQLKGVQFVRDGDAFGAGAPLSDEEFDDLSADAAERPAQAAAGAGLLD